VVVDVQSHAIYLKGFVWGGRVYCKGFCVVVDVQSHAIYLKGFVWGGQGIARGCGYLVYYYTINIHNSVLDRLFVYFLP
jgi:hypothetical protein